MSRRLTSTPVKTAAASAVLAFTACAGMRVFTAGRSPGIRDDVNEEALCWAERSPEAERLLNVPPGVGGSGAAGTPFEPSPGPTDVPECAVIPAE